MEKNIKDIEKIPELISFKTCGLGLGVDGRTILEWTLKR